MTGSIAPFAPVGNFPIRVDKHYQIVMKVIAGSASVSFPNFESTVRSRFTQAVKPTYENSFTE